MQRKGLIQLTIWLPLLSLLIAFISYRPQPLQAATSTTPLPIGQDSWKIELNTDGIYRLTYAELQAAGLPVDSIDPHTLALLWRGQRVAYQIDGDADGLFEPDEAILFYGWQFDGSRDERQYVETNVFWLWAEDTAGEMIETVANEADHALVTVVSAEITTQPENTFSTTYTNRWDSFPNAFDAWYWRQIDQTAPATFTVTLPYPAPTNDPANYLVEVLNRNNGNHSVSTRFNNFTSTTHTWSGLRNSNLTQTIPASILQNGTNTITLAIQADNTDRLLINRISVQYPRQLRTDNDFLQFETTAGAQTFALTGFSTPNDLLFWNISNRLQPQAIDTTGSFDLATQAQHIGGTFSDASQFVATTTANLRRVDKITAYHAPDLDPANGAEWVAIAHQSLISETNRLATHRNSHSRLSTQVVAVNDIINQYGYGLPLPNALRDYLLHATETWTTPPAYVTLVGDASLNPRGLVCQTGCSTTWAENVQTLVPTYLLAQDRFIGLVASDHFFSTLVGDDDRPDIAIGRLPAQTPAQLRAMVDKIIRYEANLISAETWMQNLLFVSDNADGAGDFCTVNAASASDYPSNFTKNELCLDTLNVTSLRDSMFAAVNEGVLIANYLGHGYSDKWAGEGILTKQDTGNFTNNDKPFIQISGNCLDGNFAWLGGESISETMLALDNAGSVAHWGSTGLGYLLEHQVLHDGFTQALGELGITRLGDAILYAKTNFLERGFFPAQAYSSLLLGDPAMQIAHSELSVDSTLQQNPSDSDQFTFVATIRNSGVLSTAATFTQTLSSNLQINSFVLSSNAQLVEIRQADGITVAVNIADLGMQETATITIGVRLLDRTVEQIGAFATVLGDGFEVNLADNSAETHLNLNLVPTAVRITKTATHSLPLLAYLSLLLTVVTVAKVKYRTTSRFIHTTVSQLRKSPTVQ